ncbi:Zinc phosphodiesterase ELAC protein 1 [Grifola frondosa]|uniref:Zinc phosphodiesterase ELAC protein 1 n=1 Tax=Grifola frondosa TaxID=5627 RepID=A0A1C7M8A9_GRIFR|nr:Zinc phosphodiesterase ELAC protein 1 [Grifola frondosa]
MSHNITVTFLGTTSGGGPSETRNCSSLVIDPVPDGSLWMIDCAEGTVRQFAQQPFHDARRVKIGRLNKIFVTHLHADHTMGLLTILRNVLGIPKPTGPSPSTPTARPQVDIYGPRGLRHLLRTLFTMTHTHTDHRYAVHELLFSGEEPSAPATFVQGEEGPCESEANGQDLRCDADGFWRGIVDVQKVGKGSVIVDAGPIEHRDPCIGYVIREAPLNPSPHTPIPRKIVILGDTHDPSAMIPLIQSSRLPSPSSSADTPPPEPSTPVTLLIHEATDAYIPPSVDPQQRTGRNRTVQSVEAKMLERGHSTPAMAGAFARQIGAEKLVLNHIGARFSAPAHPAHAPQEKFRLACMREIERQATEAWEPPHNTHAQAAWIFCASSYSRIHRVTP